MTTDASEKSWTANLANIGFIPQTQKKYIELERMLHSVVCLNLLLEGSDTAYEYWVQNQKTGRLSRDDFNALHRLTLQYANTPEEKTALEASLVYSDLGKTPQAKQTAKQFGITQSDHDDFMEAVYSAPTDALDRIIPSFKHLAPTVQNQILQLHLAVPLHWGHVLHLEGGENMFSRVVSSTATPEQIKMAYLLQVCDVAASQAHMSLKGSTAFNQATHQGYQIVLATVEALFQNRNSKLALTQLANQKAIQLGLAPSESQKSEQTFLLARMSSFLRLYTPEEGALLKKAALQVLGDFDSESWKLIEEMFGSFSGVNTWQRNPTYMPTVVLNLFNSTSDETEKYERAVQGMLVLAKILQAYQQSERNTSEIPLSFNQLAGQAKSHPEWFTLDFDASQINTDNPDSVTINEPKLKFTQTRTNK